MATLLTTLLTVAFLSAFALTRTVVAQQLSKDAVETRERIFFNGRVFTADPLNLYAEAVGVRGSRVFAVGSLADVLSLASSKADRVDLGGKTLLPGFIDSHMHAVDGGFASLAADATDKVETLEQLKAFVAEARRTRRGFRGDVLEILGLPL